MPDTEVLDPTMLKFGVGQPVPRNEDPTLLRGEGRYTDDLSLPGQAWCVMVRSPHAHGVIGGIDTGEAKAACSAASLRRLAGVRTESPIASAAAWTGERVTAWPRWAGLGFWQ